MFSKDSLRLIILQYKCKFRNSQSSLVDMKELKLLSEHMWIERCPVDPGVSRIWVNYPLNGDIQDLYRPGLSNSNQMLCQSKALFKKLKKAGLADAFQEQMDKSVNEGHMEILSEEEARAALSGPTAFHESIFRLRLLLGPKSSEL